MSREKSDLLSSNYILGLFSSDVTSAIKQFQDYVILGGSCGSPWHRLKHQLYLGSDDFVKVAQARIDPKQNLSNFPKAQYSAQPLLLKHFEQQSINRDECIAMAYDSGGFSMAEIGNYYGLHYSRVSRIIKNQRLRKLIES